MYCAVTDEIFRKLTQYMYMYCTDEKSECDQEHSPQHECSTNMSIAAGHVLVLHTLLDHGLGQLRGGRLETV